MTPRELPVIACSLDADAQGRRAGEWRALVTRATATTRLGGVARASFPPDAEPELDRLVAAEAACCPFLSFEVHRTADAVSLDVRAPEGAEQVLVALFG